MNSNDLKELRISSLIEEITSNSLQIEQLSSDVRELMYAVSDLTEQGVQNYGRFLRGSR